MCLAAIYWARCEAIYYAAEAADASAAGFGDSFLYQEVKRPLAERSIPAINLLREKALESFRAWEMSSNKVEY